MWVWPTFAQIWWNQPLSQCIQSSGDVVQRFRKDFRDGPGADDGERSDGVSQTEPAPALWLWQLQVNARLKTQTRFSPENCHRSDKMIWFRQLPRWKLPRSSARSHEHHWKARGSRFYQVQYQQQQHQCHHFYIVMMILIISPSLNHNLAHYELTWRTESFVAVTAYKLRFRLAKVIDIIITIVIIITSTTIIITTVLPV